MTASTSIIIEGKEGREDLRNLGAQLLQKFRTKSTKLKKEKKPLTLGNARENEVQTSGCDSSLPMNKDHAIAETEPDKENYISINLTNKPVTTITLQSSSLSQPTSRPSISRSISYESITSTGSNDIPIAMQGMQFPHSSLVGGRAKLLESQMKELKGQLARKETELEDERGMTAELGQRTLQLEQELADRGDKVERNVSMADVELAENYEAQIRSLKTEIEARKAQTERAVEAQTLLQSETTELLQNLERTRSGMTIMQEELSQKNAQLNGLLEQLRQSETCKQDRIDRVDNTLIGIEGIALSNDLIDSESRTRDLQRQLEVISHELQQTKHQLRERERDEEGKIESHTSTDEEIVSLKAQLQEQVQRHERETLQKQEEILAFLNQVEELNLQLRNVTSLKDACEQERHRQAHLLAQMANERGYSDKEKEEFERLVAEMQQAARDKSHDHNIERQLEESQQQVIDLERELERIQHMEMVERGEWEEARKTMKNKMRETRMEHEQALSSLRQEIAKHQLLLSEANLTHDHEQKELADSRQELSDMKILLDDHTASLANKEQEIRELKAALEKVELVASSDKTQWEDIMTKREEALYTREHELDTQELHQSNSNLDLASLKGTLVVQRKELEGKEASIAQRENDVVMRERLILEKENSISGLEKNFKDNEENVEEMIEQKLKINVGVDSILQHELDVVKGELVAAREAEKKTMKRLVKFQQEVNICRAKNCGLEKELDRVTKAMDAIKHQHNDNGRTHIGTDGHVEEIEILKGDVIEAYIVADKVEAKAVDLENIMATVTARSEDALLKMEGEILSLRKELENQTQQSNCYQLKLEIADAQVLLLQQALDALKTKQQVKFVELQKYLCAVRNEQKHLSAMKEGLVDMSGIMKLVQEEILENIRRCLYRKNNDIKTLEDMSLAMKEKMDEDELGQVNSLRREINELRLALVEVEKERDIARENLVTDERVIEIKKEHADVVDKMKGEKNVLAALVEELKGNAEVASEHVIECKSEIMKYKAECEWLKDELAIMQLAGEQAEEEIATLKHELDSVAMQSVVEKETAVAAQAELEKIRDEIDEISRTREGKPEMKMESCWVVEDIDAARGMVEREMDERELRDDIMVINNENGEESNNVDISMVESQSIDQLSERGKQRQGELIREIEDIKRQMEIAVMEVEKGRLYSDMLLQEIEKVKQNVEKESKEKESAQAEIERLTMALVQTDKERELAVNELDNTNVYLKDMKITGNDIEIHPNAEVTVDLDTTRRLDFSNAESNDSILLPNSDDLSFKALDNGSSISTMLSGFEKFLSEEQDLSMHVRSKCNSVNIRVSTLLSDLDRMSIQCVSYPHRMY